MSIYSSQAQVGGIDIAISLYGDQIRISDLGNDDQIEISAKLVEQFIVKLQEAQNRMNEINSRTTDIPMRTISDIVKEMKETALANQQSNTQTEKGECECQTSQN
jgi:predicted transcriptional regulator